MRKFLSLALALVMVLSLTLVSASAKSFTDNNDVDYNEAVDVISALNIVDGYPDGSFNPSGLLTRQAAAKIICNLILGPTTAASLKADTAPFYDVPVDNGFAGYIAYCASRGIIGGYGDGSFQPGGYLSGNAFMKMLLGALGYDATIEEFVGPNWSINVGKLAMGIGLTDDLEGGFDGSKTVNRQEAALYALNTLQATMVDYGQKIVITDANGNAQVVGHSDAANMGEGQYASYDNHKTEGGAANATLQFCERYFEDLKKTTTSDDFERPAHTWKIKTTEVGTYVDSGDLIATWTTKVTKDALYNTLGKSVVDDLKSTAADCANATLDYYVDGETMVAGKQTSAVVDQFAYRKDTDKIFNDAATTGNGALTEVYLDKDTNAVTIVTINTYVFQASSDYNSSRDEVKVVAAGDTAAYDIRLDDYNLDGEDFDIADVKEDDYLLITAYKSNGSYKVASVEPAEAVTGEVTAYTVEDKVTVDGGEYSYSLKTKKTSEGGNGDDVKSLISSTGGQVSLIMDKYGYIIAIDDTVTGGNYVFIMEAKRANLLNSSNVVAHAYFPDGTVEDITLKKLNNNTNKQNMIDNAQGWYTYSKDSSGSYSLSSIRGSYDTEARFYDVGDPADTPVTLITNGSATMYSNFMTQADHFSTTVRGNERTIYVIEDNDGDVYTYTGISNAPTVKVPSGNYTIGYVWNVKNSYATYVFISVDNNAAADVDSSTENDMYVFLLKLDSTRDNGTDKIYRYKAIVDGEVTTIDADDNGYEINRLYTKVKIDNNNDLITDMKELGANPNTEHGVTDNKYHREAEMRNAKFVYKNGVLSIDSADGSEAFVIPSTASLNIVINGRNGNNHALLVDKGADYEVHEQASGSSLAAAVSGYLVSGRWYVVTKDNYVDDNDRNVKTLYVFVESSIVDDGNGGTPPKDDEFTVTYKIDDEAQKTANVKDDVGYFDVTIDTAKEIQSAVTKDGESLSFTGSRITINREQANQGLVTITTKSKTSESGDIDAQFQGKVNIVVKDADGNILSNAGYTVTHAHIISATEDATIGSGGHPTYTGKGTGNLYLAFTAPENAVFTAVGSVDMVAGGYNYPGVAATWSPATVGIVASASLPAETVAGKDTSITITVTESGRALPVRFVLPNGYSLDYGSNATTKSVVADGSGSTDLKLKFGGVDDTVFADVDVKYEVTGVETPFSGTGSGSLTGSNWAAATLLGGNKNKLKAAEGATEIVVEITVEGKKVKGAVDTDALPAEIMALLDTTNGTPVIGGSVEFTKDADLDLAPSGGITDVMIAAAASHIQEIIVNYTLSGVETKDSNDVELSGKAKITNAKGIQLLDNDGNAADTAIFAVKGTELVKLTITGVVSVKMDKDSAFSANITQPIDSLAVANIEFAVTNHITIVRDGENWVNSNAVELTLTPASGGSKWTAGGVRATILAAQGATMDENSMTTSNATAQDGTDGLKFEFAEKKIIFKDLSVITIYIVETTPAP